MQKGSRRPAVLNVNQHNSVTSMLPLQIHVGAEKKKYNYPTPKLNVYLKLKL